MKVPVAFTLRNRAASLAQDARLLNGYAHIKRNRRDPKKIDSVHATKRPALTAAYTLTSGTGQALYVPATPTNDGIPAAVIGDILSRSLTPQKSKLAFGVQPSNGNLNTAISPSITVQILDFFGNVFSATDNITLSLFDNPTGATLGGTVTRAAVAGTATFNNITLDRSGNNFSLAASATGLRGDISDPFTIPTQLAFTIQPANGVINQPLSTVQVTAQDNLGATDTFYDGEITISLYAGSGGLSGILTVPAINGVAQFTNLQIDTPGTYLLMATASPVSHAYTPSRVVSASFTIANYSLTAASLTAPLVGYSQTTLVSPTSGGSISPTIYLGNTITGFASNPVASLTSLVISGNIPQTAFTTITANSVTLTSASAAYAYFAPTNETVWSWASTVFSAPGSYPVTIV